LADCRKKMMGLIANNDAADCLNYDDVGGWFPRHYFVEVSESLLNALWLIANHVGGPSGFK
jgi:hypothetical protein